MILLDALLSHGAFFTWRDAIEIIFFACVIYALSLWLKKDRQKNLLLYFYGYWILLGTSSWLQLSTITVGLTLLLPFLLMIFILIHQQTLQKNFVTLRNLVPARVNNEDWLEHLIQSALVMLNNAQEIICVIEYHDTLQEVMHAQVPLHADIKKGFVDMLLTKQEPSHANQMVWINHHGIVLGINAQWTSYVPAEETDAWKYQALLVTAKTDALVFKTHHTTRTFTLIMQGTVYEDNSAHTALQMIKKYSSSPTSIKTKGVLHGNVARKTTTQQPDA